MCAMVSFSAIEINTEKKEKKNEKRKKAEKKNAKFLPVAIVCMCAGGGGVVLNDNS